MIGCPNFCLVGGREEIFFYALLGSAFRFREVRTSQANLYANSGCFSSRQSHLHSGCLPTVTVPILRFLPISYTLTFMQCKYLFYCVDLGCVHTMPAHFENGEKCDGSKI